MIHIYVHTYFHTPNSSDWKLYPALLLDKLDCEEYGRKYKGKIAAKYKGKIAAVVVPTPCEIRIVNSVEHYENKVSAHYWRYAEETENEW